MGSFFTQIESSGDGAAYNSEGSSYSEEFVGGGQYDANHPRGGPGAFKRRMVRKAAMAQKIHAISGGKGDMQSSSALDMALAQSLQGQQVYLARNGGAVQDDDGGQAANRYALQMTRNEGGEEPDERGAGTFPIDWRNNPHTRDQDHDFAATLADEASPSSVPFPYDGNVHAHTDVMGATAGWNHAPAGAFPKQVYLDKDGNDTAWTPMQRFAMRLAENVPEQQTFPMMPKLGASLFPKKLG